MQKRPAIAAAVLFGLFTASAHAALTLYDGTKPGLPASQGSLAYETLLQTGTQTLSAGSLGPVTLDTTAGGSNSEYAGLSNYGPTSTFVNPAFPVLSAATGFDLTFNMEVNAESHASTDRSGVSVILLGSDSTGIELGFWTNQVWAQGTNANPSLDFNHSEGTISFNPAAGFYSYDLHVQGSTYTLSANGTQILTGPTGTTQPIRCRRVSPIPTRFPTSSSWATTAAAPREHSHSNRSASRCPSPPRHWRCRARCCCSPADAGTTARRFQVPELPAEAATPVAVFASSIRNKATSFAR